MKVLVLGSGGREHAIVRALSSSNKVSKIWAAPGNSGMQAEVLGWDIQKPQEWVGEAKKLGIDLVVIGPDAAQWVSDTLRAEGLNVFAASEAASKLETSKIFSKQFMQRSGIPTAHAVVVDSVESLMTACVGFTPPYVLKADGLAAGKGVVICQTREELKAAGRDFFEKRIFGEAGARALLEQYLPGTEISFLVLTNGKSWRALPVSQDYKRLLDGDKGLNTGGMGTVAPIALPENLRKTIAADILDPTCRGLEREKLFYRGVLYVGLMITAQGPKVIEFNARFGDPETQVILPLLDGDWAEVFLQVAQGTLPDLHWHKKAMACVILAAPGYPESPQKNLEISGLNAKGQLDTGDAYIIHAGTKRENGQWLTSGGRVLNVVAEGANMNEALEKAYRNIERIKFDGMHFRRDIGKSAQSF